MIWTVIWHLPLHHPLALEEVSLSLFATRTEEVPSTTCVCAKKSNWRYAYMHQTEREVLKTEQKLHPCTEKVHWNKDNKSKKMNRRWIEDQRRTFPSNAWYRNHQINAKTPIAFKKEFKYSWKKYILYKMSFVLKECLDKKIVTIIIGIITETRPQLSFLRRVKFLILWNRKTISARKNFPANAHPKLQVTSKYIQICNKGTQRNIENSPLCLEY